MSSGKEPRPDRVGGGGGPDLLFMEFLTSQNLRIFCPKGCDVLVFVSSSSAAFKSVSWEIIHKNIRKIRVFSSGARRLVSLTHLTKMFSSSALESVGWDLSGQPG